MFCEKQLTKRVQKIKESSIGKEQAALERVKDVWEERHYLPRTLFEEL